MDDYLFKRIISELQKLNFSGQISYHFYNEPLLRTDLHDLVKYVAKRLPNLFQILFTNGDYLTEKCYKRLSIAGINHFLVTRHDYKAIPKREFQTVLFPDNLRLSNRGGTLFKLEKPLIYPCYGPSEKLIITITGDILLCFEDAKRSQRMGNILENRITDIWFSKKFSDIRNILKKGRRDKASHVCKNCNNLDYTIPNKTWFWKEFSDFL